MPRKKKIGRPKKKTDLVQQVADYYGLKRATVLRYAREGAPLAYGTDFAKRMQLSNDEIHGTRYARKGKKQEDQR